MSVRQYEPQSRERKKGGKIILPALCSIVGTLIIVAVIALLLPSVISRFIGFEIYNVTSESMAPVLPMGSIVLVRPVEWEDISAGDIVAFDSNGAVVTHRVVRRTEYNMSLITKGDANEEEDINSAPYTSVIGRVERSVPYLGGIMSAVATPLGKIYLFAFLLCGVLFNVLAGRLRED